MYGMGFLGTVYIPLSHGIHDLKFHISYQLQFHCRIVHCVAFDAIKISYALSKFYQMYLNDPYPCFLFLKHGRFKSKL